MENAAIHAVRSSVKRLNRTEMMLKKNRLSSVAGRPLLTLALLMSLSSSLAAPVGSAFTYQGQLKGGGVPESGAFGMQFKLFDDVAAGAQVGATIDKVVAVTKGLFTVELDFGSFAFNGDARWLEISVDGVTLSLRQPLTGVPYAARALSAPNGHSLDGANGGPVDALIVDHDGQVGIGNTDPTQKLHVIDTLDAGLTFPVKIANNGASNGTAVGVLFQVGTASDRGKGAIVYERTNNFNRGDLHILQNSAADGTTPGLTNAVLTIKSAS
jgi:hypothetical protein